MKYFGKHCWWLVILLLVLGLQTTHATSEFPRPFEIEFEPITPLKVDAPISLRLGLQRRHSRDRQFWLDAGNAVELVISGDRGLVPQGPSERSGTLDQDGLYSEVFNVTIPEGDTSSVTVVIRCGHIKTKTMRWFVTTGDTVAFWKAHPRDAVPEHSESTLKGRRGRIIPGEFPDLDSIYGIPPDMIHPDYRPGSIPKQRFPSYTDAEIEAAVLERKRQEMRDFEKTPLAGASTQWIKIGDTMWTRRHGETKFRVAEPITDFEAHEQAMRDSLMAIPPSAMFDVLYEVKDSEQVATLRKHIDNLEPTRRADVFRCRISKGLIDMLEERYQLTPAFVDQGPEAWRELFDNR